MMTQAKIYENAIDNLNNVIMELDGAIASTTPQDVREYLKNERKKRYEDLKWLKAEYDYIKSCKVSINMSFTEDDVKALEQKFYVDPDGDDPTEAVTNCIWEMINTYVEM